MKKPIKISLLFRTLVVVVCFFLQLAGNHSTPAFQLESMNQHKRITNDKNIWGPFKAIPNVRSLKVVVSNWDKLFLFFNIRRREYPAKLIYTKHSNNQINRYIYHQLRRLKNCQDRTKFWRICESLLRHSNCFFVMGLNHVFPKWHRELALFNVLKLHKQVKKLIRSKEPLSYKRTMIPKSNGKLRPLGVPTPSWRIYLHMLNQFLSLYLLHFDIVSTNQHGFVPGRGTKSAWEYILEHVLPSKDIFEFDLKGFFDNVRLDFINQELRESGLPEELIDRLDCINRSTPLQSESVKKSTEKFKSEIGSQFLSVASEHNFQGTVEVKDYGIILDDSAFSSFGSGDSTSPEMASKLLELLRNSEDSFSAHQWNIFDSDPEVQEHRSCGVPQGAPTSPLLASLALNKTVLKPQPTYKSIMYADDGLYFGDLPSDFELAESPSMLEANIYYNHEKSRWIKRNHEWLIPLTFLGLVYDGNLDTLQGNTRKGSTLLYDKETLVSLMEGDVVNKERYVESSYFRKRYQSSRTWETLLKSQLFGFIQSRLYQGDWSLTGISQDFELRYNKNSYCQNSRHLPLLTVFNSTSYACEWLLGKLKSTKK